MKTLNPTFKRKQNHTKDWFYFILSLILIALSMTAPKQNDQTRETSFTRNAQAASEAEVRNLPQSQTNEGRDLRDGREDRPVSSEPGRTLQTRLAEFSAYTSEVGQTDSSPFITANGTDLRKFKGCVVANNALPFGAKIEIEGFGICTVMDRMNRRYKENNFDIYFGVDKVKALKFGRQKLNYTILN